MVAGVPLGIMISRPQKNILMYHLPVPSSHLKTVLQTGGNLGVRPGVDRTEQETHVGKMGFGQDLACLLAGRAL